jgi:hypothetical protein
VIGHVSGRPLAAQQDAEHVHAHQSVEVVEIVVEETAVSTADTGVVAHDMQTTEALDREVDDSLDLLGFGDVGLHERRRVTEVVRQPFARLVLDVGDDDLGPLA